MISGEVEVWKPVVGYEGRYEVNENSQIRTLMRRNKRILKHAIREDYFHHFVNITDSKGIRKKKYIHIAALEAFVSLRPEGKEGLHNDGNPYNNHISNLRWGTHSENMQDSIKHGTFYFVGQKGSKHPHAILNESKVMKIKKLFLDKSITRKQIADKYGVCASTIDYIKSGKLWSHVKI